MNIRDSILKQIENSRKPQRTKVDVTIYMSSEAKKILKDNGYHV